MPKVLVANRGEIAIRILRSARELGWTTVALYTTEPNPDISHATYADEAVKLDNVEGYMNVNTIASVAQQTHCTHVHPGYGFLSESPALSKALSQLQPPITFIGPAPDTLSLASDKMLSRNLASSLGVPVAPGKRVASSAEIRAFASEFQYPIIIKALDGGGGRGIRIVQDADAVDESFQRCMGESPSRQLFVEKALTGPGWKHVEVQIIGDGTGTVNHLWERECSIQRRFQKIMEIAPARLPRSKVQPLIEVSLRIAAHLKYKGLGTFEYLVDTQSHQWVFMEINPRLQVEHTVTEEVMDIDLVRTQLLLFSPSTKLNSSTLRTLSLDTPPPFPSSTSIQLRLTAEDPENNFLLTPGVIHCSDIQWPAGRGVRVDTWLSSSHPSKEIEWTVGTDFDSLLAKIIIRGSSIEEATQKAQRALQEFRLNAKGTDERRGMKTNAVVLAGVLGHRDWEEGTIGTLWLERNLSEVMTLGRKDMEKSYNSGSVQGLDLPAQHRSSSTSVPHSGSGTTLLQPGSLFHVSLTEHAKGREETERHTLTLTSIAHNAFPEKLSGTLQSTFSPTPLTFSLTQTTSASVSGNSGAFELANPNDPTHIAAPMTGKIIELHPAFKPQDGEGNKTNMGRIKKGETLIVLSVMKMENAVVAPQDGTVERIGKGVKTGVVVAEGMLICVVSPSSISRL